MNARILASTAFRIVASSFQRHVDVKHKCFRIKNLLADEVAQFVDIWDREADTTVPGKARLVIAEDLGGTVPAGYVAAADRSITYYRNNNPEGLVYLETRVQSDEQGLQNIFTLRDSNFLDGSFDESAGGATDVPQLLTRESWHAVTDRTTPAPQLLVERAAEVLRHVHPRVEAIPVRRFVRFARALCEEWSASRDAVDEAAADAIVGRNLWQLGLFPDELWRKGAADARIRRRFELNARHANLTTGTAEIEVETVEASAAKTKFVNSNGEPLPPAESAMWATRCVAFARNPGDDLRSGIPYRIFEQLFARDTKGMRLGDKVKAAIEDADAARLRELDALDVVDGLNVRSQLDAERLLAAPPQTASLPPLVDLLPVDVRRLVERLASPPARRFFNPATELVRLLVRLRAQGGDDAIARLTLERSGDASPHAPAAKLFAFLFGPTLQRISDGLGGLPGAIELHVDRALTGIGAPPPLRQDSEGGEDDGESESESESVIAWENVPLKLTAYGRSGEPIETVDHMEWASDSIDRLAMTWLLMADPDTPLWSRLGASSIDQEDDGPGWMTPFIQRSVSPSTLQPAGTIAAKGENPVLDEFLEARLAFGSEVCADGLSTTLINTYVDAWSELIGRARSEFVPDGRRLAPMDALLGADMLVQEGRSRRTMLPSHPLRLRWLARYLEASAALAVKCLSGETAFATGEGDQYLDWLESRTPHESPPVASGFQGELLFAKSETGWFEDFDVLEGPAGVDSVDDPAAVESIASRIVSYLDAHAYKKDGLSVLLVLPSSDGMPAALLSRITRGQWRDLRCTLTIAAPKRRWESIARALEQLGQDDRTMQQGRYFPARDIAFVEYERADDLQVQLGARIFDISVVTHVLHESMQCQENTEAPTAKTGRFDPLEDRPASLEVAGGGGSISIVMRPRFPDPQLESWGTLVVRGSRSRPVAPSQPENTDFVELRVNFENSARVFNTLHACSHWVITLERHISREQIESIEAGAPAVLSMESGVGNNGLSTLVVSSRSGRELIATRIIRKLKRLVPADQIGRTTSSALQNLSTRIYDETRRLSPHLALKAMGTSRVTEEILGLMVARTVAEERLPLVLDDGMSAWLSLDEHLDWFAGISSFRADMCRITFVRDRSDGSLLVEVLVLEGKLRQTYDPHGVTQVRQTMQFFGAILAGRESEKPDPVDGPMWRERILSAIELTAAEARSYARTRQEPLGDRGTELHIPLDIRHSFRDGRFRLRSLEGIYSSCLWEETHADPTISTVDRVTIIRSTNAHLLALAGREIDPTLRSRIVKADSLDRHPDGPAAPDADSSGNLQPDGIADHAEAFPDLTEGAAPPTVDDGKNTPQPAHFSNSSTVGPRVRMEPARLRQIYESILGCLASHGVAVTAAPAQDVPVIEGPASILFKVRPSTGVDPKKVSEKGQALKLALALEQDQNVGFGIDLGYVTIDVPKTPDQRYYVDAGALWQAWERPVAALAAPLGEDRFGKMVEFSFSSSNSPHLLVGGTTGSGKSEALNTLLFGMARHYSPAELRLLLVDPKGTELTAFSGSPHLEGDLGWDDADALGLLQRAVEEMQRRYALFKAAGRRTLAEFNDAVPQADRLPWWLVVLDEYADLTHDPQAKKDIEQELRRLAQKARAAGIHLIIATQKPSAEVISTNLRSNLPAQLALRVKSATESRVVLDEAGAEVLNGRGDALLKSDGRVVRVQCARVKPEDQTLPAAADRDVGPGT
ncbi:DNA translocase FtsK [Variovorax paradoxus]|nr:FtsK/SpoIIIE domain-containing protein [Variovorax paradoxus]MBT2303974.1 DNA translocase FtsK [Variovorax paradoxus]